MKNYTVVPFDTENDNLLLIGYLYKPEGEGPFDCAVLCHGFYDDLNNNTDLAETLASNGLVVLNFDFNTAQGDGIAPKNSLTPELNTLKEALKNAKADSNLKNIYLIGLTNGVNVSAMAAKDNTDIVSKLVLINPVFEKENIEDVKGYSNPALILYNDSDSISDLTEIAKTYSNCKLIQNNIEEQKSTYQASEESIKEILDFLEK